MPQAGSNGLGRCSNSRREEIFHEGVNILMGYKDSPKHLTSSEVPSVNLASNGFVAHVQDCGSFLDGVGARDFDFVVLGGTVFFFVRHKSVWALESLAKGKGREW